jgi:hypothetical protein
VGGELDACDDDGDGEGQAGGVAAALSIDRKTTPAELRAALVRQALHQQHAAPRLRPRK